MGKQDDFFKNCLQYFRGIEICLQSNLVLPTLTLIYSGIDAFSWLAYGDIGVKDRFTKWVEDYLYKTKRLNPSPIDLYAARCAILHTLTPDSNLSNRNRAKLVTYAWGTGKIEDLEKSIDLSHLEQTTCVHLSELHECFKNGVLQFFETDGESKECQERMFKHFSNTDMDILKTFINSKA